jgi:hypothetical protein
MTPFSVFRKRTRWYIDCPGGLELGPFKTEREAEGICKLLGDGWTLARFLKSITRAA